MIWLSRSNDVRLHLSLSQANISLHYVRKLKILLLLVLLFLQLKLVPRLI